MKGLLLLNITALARDSPPSCTSAGVFANQHESREQPSAFEAEFGLCLDQATWSERR
jgi:hypothetical protein